MKKRYLLIGILTGITLAMGAVACNGAQGDNGNGDTPGDTTPPVVTPGGEHVSTVTGFDIPATLNYFYGSCIDLLNPVVIDDLGNVVDVSSSVKTASGEAVTAEFGKFFAMENEGYTVEYTVQTLDGKTHSKSTKINVVESIFVEGVQLIDVGEETSFDIPTLLTEEQQTAVEGWKNAEGVQITLTKANTFEKTVLDGMTVDFTKTPKAYYSFAVEMPIGYPVEQQEVFRAKFDFYNSAEGIVWLDGLSESHLFTKTSTMTAEIATENLPAGATAEEYYHVASSKTEAGGDGYVFSVVGLHSKEYYQKFKNEGSATLTAYSLLMDFYHTSEENKINNSEGEYTYFYMNGNPNTHFYEGTWNTVEIPLADLITCFEAYPDKLNLNCDRSYCESWNMVYSTDAQYYGVDIDGYWGNFRFRQTRDISAVQNPNLTLVDMNGANAYDFTNILSDEEKAQFAEYATAGNIVWKLNGEEITDWTQVEGIYELTATLVIGQEQTLVYSAPVDIYDSTDGLVWTTKTGLREGDVYCKTANTTVSVATGDLPQGLSATEYYKIETADCGKYFVTAVARHSKAYYEMWLQSGDKYKISFEMYYTSETVTLGYSTFTFAGHETELAGECHTQIFEGTATTVTLTLDSLMRNFANFYDNERTDVTDWTNNFIGWEEVIFDESGYVAPYDMVLYLGNFTVQKY